MSKLSRVLTALCLLVGLSASVLAQSTTTGAIGVTVKDPQGAVVPNATVTVHNEETNTDATATTDSEGLFIRSLTFTPDGRQLATANSNTTVYLLDLP